MKNLFLFLIFFISPLLVSAQMNISDQQLINYAKIAQQKGYTAEQLKTIARSRGYTESQIKAIEERYTNLNVKETEPKIDAKKIEVTKPIVKKAQTNRVVPKPTKLNLFGSQFFNGHGDPLNDYMNTPVPPEYIIKAGDEILIHIYGASELNYQEVVSKDGFITISNIGPIYVGNLSFKAMKEVVFSKLVTIYHDLINPDPKTFATITVGQINGIKVNVIGNVKNPGSYDLPGTANLFQALNISDGLTSNGSFRNVQVIRNNEIVANLDLYDYLIYKKTKANILLLNNDIVYVPNYINHISISGEVRKPGIYELKDGETLADILNFAEGFTAKAKVDRIDIDRFGIESKVYVNADDLYYELQNGDHVKVKSILNEYDNKIIISGAVKYPGSYDLTNGSNLKTIIEKAILEENAFTERAFIKRLDEFEQKTMVSFNVQDVISGKDTLNLQNNDQVIIKTIEQMQEKKSIGVYGYILHQGEFEYRKGMTLNDAIALAGGFRNIGSSDFIEVVSVLDYDEAKNYSDQIVKIKNFAIERDLKLSMKDSNYKLNPYDRIYIKKAPGYDKAATVNIYGQVAYAGTYQISNRKEKISDLIVRAGGLTPAACKESAILVRSLSNFNRLNRDVREYAESDTTIIVNTKVSNRIPIDLEEILTNPEKAQNLYLQDGDAIMISKIPQTVEVMGNVLNPTIIPYEKNISLKKYINNCGGFDELARKSKTYVIRMNGKGQSTKQFMGIRSYPKIKAGDIIIVPEKKARDKMTLQDMAAMLTGLTGTFVGFAVLFKSL